MPNARRAEGHFSADLSQADQSQRPSEQAPRFRKFRLVPLARAQRRDVVGNAAIERQHQPEGQLGHGDGIFPGTIGNINSAPRRRRHVDGVVSRAGAHHQLQRARRQNRLRSRGSSVPPVRRPRPRPPRAPALRLSSPADRKPRTPPPSIPPRPDCSNLSAMRTRIS